MDKVHVICLKWGDKYSAEYVNKLFNSVKRNTTVPFSFTCFTEDPGGIDSDIRIEPLPHSTIQSWWNKLYLFSNAMPFNYGDRILFIDLDTVITGNIDDIMLIDNTDIVVLRDFYTGYAKTVVGNDNVGSGLMSWKHGRYPHIWDTFIENPDAAIEEVMPHGDQKWVQKIAHRRVYWQDVLPDQVVSYKVHCADGLPGDARIICYHGKPSIPESETTGVNVFGWHVPPSPWIMEFWK